MFTKPCLVAGFGVNNFKWYKIKAQNGIGYLTIIFIFCATN